MILLALLACSGPKTSDAVVDSAAVDSTPDSAIDSTVDSTPDTQAPAQDCSGATGAPGKQFIEVDGESAWVLVPAEAGPCAPLFIFGHGGSSPGGVDEQGNWRDTGTGLAALAPASGFILLVPFLEDSPMTQHIWSLAELTTVDAFVAEVAGTWDVDRQRVLFAGTSAGGYAAAYYGLYQPQVPTSIAVISAGLGTYFDYPEAEPAPKRPFYVAHDPDDAIIDYSHSETLAQELEAHGHDFVFDDLDLEGNGHFTNPEVWARVAAWWLE